MADQASTVSGVHVQAGQVDSNGSRLRDPPSPSGSDAERGHDHAGDRTSQIVNGIRFDAVGSDDLIAIVQSFVECGNSHIVHFLAVDPTVRASRDPAYRAELNGGDINIADGQPVAWSARLKGAFTKRIAGTDALELLCAAGVENGQAHYLYGSTQDVSERLEHHLRDRYAGIRIVGAEVPPMGMPAESAIAASAREIRNAGTDLLWIGIGTPNQHHVANRLRAHNAAPVILCVGAAFDFACGAKKRAPRWMQTLGVEWVHRLASEPRRLGRRYVLEGPRFVTAVLRECLGRRER